MECNTAESSLCTDICSNYYRLGDGDDVVLSLVPHDSNLSTEVRFYNLLVKHTDKTANGQDGCSPIYLCAECEN
eukprot:6994522-Ditylum_brightwellii.AAC.1